MKSVKLMGAALAACALMAGTAFAAPREAAPTAFDPIAHQRVVEVSEQLRCLVCQNQSIADSNAELAVDLRNQVIEQVKAGKTNKEIANTLCISLSTVVSHRKHIMDKLNIHNLSALTIYAVMHGYVDVNMI